jgi:hypothetical protein
MQADWPSIGGKLRDLTTNPGQWDGSSSDNRCHVLDRFKPFMYRYKPAPVLTDPGFSTLDRGACHTGRLYKEVKDYTVTSTRCVRNGAASMVECDDGSTYALTREQTTLPADMAARITEKRRTCDQCSAVPQFYSGTSTMPAESSFGVPFRWSTERMWARDLREVICGGNDTCPLINTPEWAQDRFWRNYMQSPAKLFTVSSTLTPEAATSEPSEDALWAKPWVLCPTKTALLTLEGCNGTIPRAEWQKDRVGTCQNTMTDLLKSNPNMMGMNTMCNIDSNLDKLCVAISEAQKLVYDANCLKARSPECALYPFM